ncbi:hypothetical protein [Streptococcus sp. E24BD]|uniref:hypothetical protein n=1 Tax=Streptococcus sp. E24BD TaxID=3278715 RepID=UPI00359CD151
MGTADIFGLILSFGLLIAVIVTVVYAYKNIPLVRGIFTLFGKLFWGIGAILWSFLNYIGKSVGKSVNDSARLSNTTPLSGADLDAIGADREERRRNMLDAEKRAQQAETRARQTQHHQDQLRASQARADAARERARY